MQLVIVESPAKAKTINKYLGKDYEVLASFGHIRDLPAKNGSVDPNNDFTMLWELDSRGEARVRELAKAAKRADSILLATDPDREGEAISWHLQQVLRDKKAISSQPVQRIVFHEITKNAIVEAIKQPRAIDQNLVDAYLARRALDYLVGFTLSPVLWRKLPGSKSAGRVQSVALRLICDRESEIEAFNIEEYWSIHANFLTTGKEQLTASLRVYDGQKLDKLDIKNQNQASSMVAVLEKQQYAVDSVERKKVQRHPAPPFITSTLQQEAARKLGFSATQTMRTAQQLYEGVDIGGETVGLITYMRTDGVTLAKDAIFSCRDLIKSRFGADYVPDSPRMYKSKAKNAQEAHEAIRPTDISRLPQNLKAYLEPQQLALYDLIWKRTIACQMQAATMDRVSIDIASSNKQHVLTATGSVVLFDGFLKVYAESFDDTEEEGERRLPNVSNGEACALKNLAPEQHFTQPPPRYSEASLVKKMEELGIGRPSTYASILQVLKDREYVKLEQKRFFPEERGRLVVTFLATYFAKYVEYNFTADLETQLDDISAGEAAWKKVLRTFWTDFHGAIEGASSLKIGDVLAMLEQQLAVLLFPKDVDGKPNRVCPACTTGQLNLRLGKFGAFISCSNYPTCSFTRQFGSAEQQGTGDAAAADHTVLGTDPVTGLEITVRKGPYGLYVQRAALPDTKDKPRRTSLPKGVKPGDVTLEQALNLLALPRDVGLYPETGQMITAGIGPFGPYVKVDKTYVSLGKNDDVLSIGLNRATVLIAEGLEKAKGKTKLLGQHKKKDVVLTRVRFGYVVVFGKKKIKIPKNIKPLEMTLEQAVALIDGA